MDDLSFKLKTQKSKIKNRKNIWGAPYQRSPRGFDIRNLNRVVGHCKTRESVLVPGIETQGEGIISLGRARGNITKKFLIDKVNLKLKR
jgi:hypothetical protein